MTSAGDNGSSNLAVLQRELAKARERLNNVDQDIRALGGFDNIRGNGSRNRRHEQRNQGDGSFPGRRALQQRNEGSSAKRRRQDGQHDDRNQFSYESPSDTEPSSDEEGETKMQSSIVVTGSRVDSSVAVALNADKTREDEIAKQQKDGEAQARNKRLFGAMLMGTLRKFKSEMDSHSELEKKRSEIAQRLEEKERSERAERDAKSRELKNERMAELRKVREMEMKIRMLSEFELWEKSIRPLGSFIKTNVEPPIYWLPAKLSPSTEALLQKHRKLVEDQIAHKKRELDEDTAFLGVAKVSPKEEEKQLPNRRRFLPEETNESVDLPEDDEETSNDLVPVAPGANESGVGAGLPSSQSDEEHDSSETANGSGSIVKQESMMADSSTSATASNSVAPVPTPSTLMEQDSQQPQQLPTPPIWTDENAQMGTPSTLEPGNNGANGAPAPSKIDPAPVPAKCNENSAKSDSQKRKENDRSSGQRKRSRSRDRSSPRPRSSYRNEPRRRSRSRSPRGRRHSPPSRTGRSRRRSPSRDSSSSSSSATSYSSSSTSSSSSSTSS